MATPDEAETVKFSTTETKLDELVSCSPCDADGKRLEAVGYCVTCKEYLCETCFKCHRIPSLMRKHVLLDKDQMESNGGVNGDKHKCQIHPERTVEYHCPKHSCLGCHVCFYRHQEFCKDSKYIQDVYEVFIGSSEFKEFRTSLDTIASKANDIMREAKRKPESIEERFGVNVEAIKAYKSQILEKLDILEQELIKTTEKLKTVAIMNMTTIVDRCAAIQETTRTISTEIEVLQNKSKNFELYLNVVYSQNRLVLIDEEINNMNCDKDSKPLTFKGDEDLLETLGSSWGLGHFVELGGVYSVRHVTSINVDTNRDMFKSSVSGSALMKDSKLVIGDFGNKKVKLLDTKQRKVC